MTTRTQTNPVIQVSKVLMFYTSPFVFSGLRCFTMRTQRRLSKTTFYPHVNSTIPNGIAFPPAVPFASVRISYFPFGFVRHCWFVLCRYTHLLPNFWCKYIIERTNCVVVNSSLGRLFFPLLGVFRFRNTPLVNSAAFRRTKSCFNKLGIPKYATVFSLVRKRIPTLLAFFSFEHNPIVNLITLCSNSRLTSKTEDETL